MAKQQRSRQQKAPVRTSRKKSKQSSKKGLIVVLLLLVSLTTLIVASIYAFKDEKDGQIAKTISDKIESVKKKEPTTEKKVIKEQEKPKAKTEVAKPEQKDKKAIKKDEDIVALIRLVLFDYELSRAAVSEKMVVDKDGMQNVSFTITTSDDMIGKIRTTLNSLLSKKGFRTKVNKKTILAVNDKGSVEIEFIIPETKVAKQGDKIEDTKRDKKSGRKEVAKKSVNDEAVKTEARPTPPAKSSVVVKMAILLDDGGANYTLAERFVKLRYPVAIAILPHLQYSKDIAKLASSYKKTIFLHFPMEPKSYPSADPGEGAALVNMPEVLVKSVVKYNVTSLGVPIDGVNNHMGSAFTEDRTKMNQVLTSLKDYTQVFVDSRTTADSVAYDECVKLGMRCGVNKRFIDNHNNVNYILERIYEAADIAKADGSVLIIGHMRSKTLDALEIALPILQERNINIVPIEQLIR